MNQKTLLFSLVLSTFSLLNAQEKVTKGKNVGTKVNVQSYTVSTSELFSSMSHHHRCHAHKCQKCKNADSGCIVDTPVVPLEPTVQNPNAPAVAFFPNSGASNQLVPPTQSVGFKFLAATPQLNPIQLGTPPDTMGVIGPEQFIIAINQGIVSFDKKTGKRDWVLNAGQGTFGVPNEMVESREHTFDPRIRYDTFSQRWYITYDVLEDFSTFANNGFYLAVSDSPIITLCTQWKLLFIPNNTLIPNVEGCIGDLGGLLDHPQLGIDKHAVYISAVMFPVNDPASPFFLDAGATVFVIPKESLLCDDKPIVTAFRDISGFSAALVLPTAHPADNFDQDAQFGYLIGTVPLTFGKLNLWRIVDPGSNQPTLVGPFGIDVLTTAFSGKFQAIDEKNNAYGITGQLATIFNRQVSVHVRNGQLYTVQNTVVNKNGISVFDEVNQTALGDRIAVRWAQIDLTGDPTGNAGNTENANTVPALVQAGTLFDARDTNVPLSYIHPSLRTNKDEDMVIGATLAGLDSVAKAFFVSRRKSDPLGTLRVGPNYEGTVFAESSGIFTRSLSFSTELGELGGRQRWDDYTMTSVDPENDTTFWTIQEVHRGILEDLWVARLDAKKDKVKQ